MPPKTKSDKQYDAYMREVESYLNKVKSGRRVPSVDPTAPRFSQQADDERQARRAGLGKYLQYGPPSPAWKNVAPPAPLSPQELRIVQQQDQPAQTAPSSVWGFHEPTITAGEGVEAGMKGAGAVLSDPRNAWMGLGPLSAMSRGNAAYHAVSRSAAKMMDQPGFMTKRPHYGPEPVSHPEEILDQYRGLRPSERNLFPRWLSEERGSFNPGSWFGMGQKVKPTATDTGGFNVPTSKMMRDDPHMARLPELWEDERRGDYLFGRRIENEFSRDLMEGSPDAMRDAQEAIPTMLPHERESIQRVLRGMAELEGEKAKTRNSTSGGAQPPYWFRAK
jgi:hypothetical protein